MASSKKPGRRKKTGDASVSAPRKPSWPSVTPKPLPHHHIPPLPVPAELLPGVLVLDTLFTPETCASWASFLLSPSSPVHLSHTPAAKRGEATRTNLRFSVHDEAFAAELWVRSGLQRICEQRLHEEGCSPVGLNPNVRIYAYPPKSFFGPHYDDDFRDPVTGLRSRWTLLIYLTGEENGVKGGATVFHPSEQSPVSVACMQGRALLHRHGSRCLLHEGQVVTEGTKLVLRSDVMFKQDK